MKSGKSIRIYGFILLFATIVPVLAAGESTTAEAQTPLVLTMEDALELVRDQNHQIHQAQADVQRSQLAVDEARAGRFPTLSVDGRYTNNVALPVMVLPADSPFGEGVLRTGTQHNFNATAQVSVPIYSPQLNRSIDLAQTARDLEKALEEATEQEMEIEVQRAFLNGLITLEAYQVLQQSHDTLQRNLELVESLYAEGAAPEYDLIRTEVQVRNLEPELSSALNNHEGALNYLKLVTGIAITEAIDLDGTLEDLYESLPELDFDPDFQNNRDLIQVQGQRELVDRQLHLERGSYLPTLSAFGNFTYQGQGDDLSIWDYNWSHSGAVGVMVSIPIITPGLRQRVEQIEVEQRQVAMQRDFLTESLHSQFQTTASRIDELEATIAAQERNIAQAERGYDIALASYEEGVHSLIDVNDAEGALRDARLNYMMAINDYINAVLDMEDLVGSTHTTSVYGPR